MGLVGLLVNFWQKTMYLLVMCQTNVGKIVQSLGILYKWWVIAIVVIINILVLLSLRGARQTVIVQAPQSVQGTSVQPKTLPCESAQPQLEKSNEMKIF